MISQAEFMYIIEQGIAISNHDYRCYGEHANVYITARRKSTPSGGYRIWWFMAASVQSLNLSAPSSHGLPYVSDLLLLSSYKYMCNGS